MKIIIDAAGGDNAPLAPLAGAAAAVAEYGLEVIAVGEEEKLRACAAENGIPLSGITFYGAQTEITMEEEATDILKKKANSSMAVGLKLLAAGEGDAFVSAGSTGALLVGATGFVKRIKGVKRAALATMLPGKNAPFLLLDCGANVECRPEMLVQFALLGSAYMEKVAGRENPSVRLVNNGEEETKGTENLLAAYALLKEAPGIRFCGNVEARDIISGDADVVVADGFTGNVVLKLTEGVAAYLTDNLKEMFFSSTKHKLAALLVKDGLKEFKAKLDYTEYGGAPLLGISKPVIKAHGSSNAKAFKNAIRQARDFASSGANEFIAAHLAAQKGEAENGQA